MYWTEMKKWIWNFENLRALNVNDIIAKVQGGMIKTDEKKC